MTAMVYYVLIYPRAYCYAVYVKRRNNMNATDSDDCSDDERTTPYCILLAIRYRRILC